jgi:hypothetical protein
MTDFDTQGKVFIRFRNKYKNLINKNNVEEIGIVEGMQGDLSLDDADQIEKLQLRQLETSFNKDLTLYTTKYKLYLDQLMGRQRGGSTYSNKVISYNGEKYFVQTNNKLRKFTDASWAKKGANCSEPISVDAAAFAKLQSNGSGVDMGENERCKSGGYSATNGTANAWIDTNGYKNIYEDKGNIHSSCPKNFVNLTNKEWIGMTSSGSTMGYNDICDRGTLDSPLHDQLKVLNNRLIQKAEKMKEIINKLKTHDKNIEDNVDEQRTLLMKKSKELNSKRKLVIQAENRARTLRGDLENKILKSESINLKKMVWVVAGITFILVASHKLSKSQ